MRQGVPDPPDLQMSGRASSFLLARSWPQQLPAQRWAGFFGLALVRPDRHARHNRWARCADPHSGIRPAAPTKSWPGIENALAT